MDTKALTVAIKAGPADGLAEGEFTAYASVFGNVDSYGDKVMPGAFAADLKAWKSSGNPIPLLWGHDMQDPMSNIGSVVDAKEDDHGLLVTGQIDLGSTPKADQVYRLVKGRRVNQMSFAYDVLERALVEKDGETFVELKQLKLYEVSIVPIGANDQTEILSVKALERIAHDVKAGRVLSAKNESALRSAHEAIGNVLDALNSDTGSASGKGRDDAAAKATAVVPAANPSAYLAALDVFDFELSLT